MSATRFAAAGAALLALAGVASAAVRPGKLRGFDIDAFGHLPVLDGGRVKPIDSLARNSLLVIRGRQGLVFEGRSVSADEWLLEVVFRHEVADRQPIFVIDDPDVLGLVGLGQTAERHFSFQVLAPHLEEIQRQAHSARAIDGKLRTRFQAAIAILFDRLVLYWKLRNTVQLAGQGTLEAEIQARNEPEAVQRQESLAQLAAFRPVPPPEGGDQWLSVGEALRAARGAPPDPALTPLTRLASAWDAQDAAGFNRAVADLRSAIGARQREALGRADSECFFNRVQPFYAGMVIYLLALLTLFASWLWKRELLQSAAFGLLGAGVLVHTAGLVARILLQGRPPVTNLYSSAVFVGWCAVVLGIVLERMYRRGFVTAIAAAVGFASLIIAHHLSADGDTMEMMRAVLDSNFWLATHVVTITIGYGGTFLAGALAIGYTLRKQLAPRIDPAATRTLVSMTYGILCFALFFSFVGTVLGGIWADQSWGRFWGWDPKENGALLIVLWNALILHARWGGYVRERGIMTMAIFGNVVTSLSWFGVNMLGIGLHSYGFIESAFWALAAFIASQLLLMGLCTLPRRFWKGAAAAEVAAQAAATQP